MAQLAADKKRDLHNRTPEQQERDAWFNGEWRRLTQEAGRLAQIDAAKLLYAAEGSFVTVARSAGEKEDVKLLPGVYDMPAARKATEKYGAAMRGTELARAIAKDAQQRFGVVVQPESEGRLGGRVRCNVALTPDGYILVPGMEQPVLGTAVVFNEDGTQTFGSIAGKDEFLRWLPAIQSGLTSHNSWCFDMPTEKVAHLADEVTATLAMLEDQLKNLHGVSIYMIAPRWFRYFSDGSIGHQISDAYGNRATEAPSGGLRTMLYDAPAWVVGLRFGEKLLPGRVFVTPEGKFICSDWCQRELGKDTDGIDLHTGSHTKHTLMTWCAGPGLSRFGEGSSKLQKLHGEVRRAKIDRTILSGRNKNNPEHDAKKSLASILIKIINNPDMITPELPHYEADGIKSLRVVRQGTKIGLIAAAKWKRGKFSAVAVSANTKGKTIDVKTLRVETTPLRGPELSVQDPHSNISIFWQGRTTGNSHDKITDPVYAKEAFKALVTACGVEI